MKFYICKHCKNIIVFVKASGVPVKCCGEDMTEIIAGSVDAATEKHVPVVLIDGDLVKVSVGEVTHPMTEEHYIDFICVETDKGYQIKYLSASDEPYAEFKLANESVKEVYAHCNLHGLWKA